MSTIILNCFCDSILEKLCEKLGTCTPEVVETGINYADIAMTLIICVTIAGIALFTIIGFLAWKLMDHIANKNSETRKRVWDVEDIMRKQKSELLTKKMDLLKELCIEDSNKKNNATRVDSYLDTLKEELKKL